MRRISTMTCLAAIAGLTIGLPACTSSTEPGSSGDEVVIGDLGAYSGIMAPQAGGIPSILDGWAKSINDSGGIGGRQVRIVRKDIGNSGTGASITAAKELVTQDKVDVIVPNDGSDLTWVPYVTEQGVPVVSGSLLVSALFDPMAFPLTLDSVTMGYAYAKTAVDIGPKVALAYAAEIPATKGVIDQVKAFGQPLGLDVSYSQGVSSSLPDYTALCQSIKDSGADSFALFYSKDIGTTISQQCYDQGLRIPQIVPDGVLTPSSAQEQAYQGSVTIGVGAPYFDSTVPGVKAYREMLDEYVPGFNGSEQDTAGGLTAYAAVEVVRAAVEGVEGEVTPASLTSGLYKLKDESVAGIIDPVTFTEGQPTSRNCWFSWQIKDNQFVVGPSKDDPICVDPTVTQPMKDELVKSLK